MTAYRPDEFAFLTGALSSNPYPSGISAPSEGGKFDFQGNVLPWPGNTIICHIDPDSDAHATLASIQDTLKKSAHADAFTFLPASSFHMTVFQGISGSYKPGCEWPSDVPTASSRDSVTRILYNRLNHADLPRTHTIKPLNVFAGHSITIDGSDTENQLKLRDTREQLRHITGIESAGFDSYTFHITLAYLLRWLSDDEALSVVELSRQLSQQLTSQISTITLGKLELCNFDNMHHFEPIAFLGADNE